MRIDFKIKKKLLKRAMKGSGTATKSEVIEAALLLLIKMHSPTSIKKLRGKVKLKDDLEESRLGRNTDDVSPPTPPAALARRRRSPAA
jgi:hypothetical protein